MLFKSPALHFLILFAVAESVFGIECYTCFSPEDPDCLNPEKYKMPRVRCDTDNLRRTFEYASRIHHDYKRIFDVHIQESAVPLNCLKHVVKVGSTDVILRGCQLPKDNTLDVCTKVLELKPQNINLQHCSLCPTDGCNGSSPLLNRVVINFNLFLTTFFVLSVLTLRY